MNLSASDLNCLIYLLKTNTISYEQVIDWSYSQYTDNGVNPLIEKISLACDVNEIVELIRESQDVNGEPEAGFILGEVASKYSNAELTLFEAIDCILYRYSLDLTDDIKATLYTAEDLYDWHEQAEVVAKSLVLPLFNKYKPIYEGAVSRFRV